ncbi:glycosyltransferase family 2 protein [Cryobacterium sp. Y57]|uniref:glycosyltransferase family 2 protein n=1 Tax=Cryobacterium sp. Y57 TaxID=2048287 RepID=UPI000CE56DF9|nr:glycosyltransferase family 2 protein [Cryobacterium sp. Y57]
MNRQVLHPAMASEQRPDWPGAVWVGEIDAATIAAADAAASVLLACSAGYSRARLLVRDGARIRGFIDIPIEQGKVGCDVIRDRIADLAPAPDVCIPHTLPTFTVVVCTRDRPAMLREALRSIVKLDYPHFSVIVVDNASATSATQDLVAQEFQSGLVTVVVEPVPGLSRARNAGLRHATGEFVAYTDDDVVVDRNWLRGLAAGFARGDDVDCVCGLVPSGELRTEVQLYFDGKVTWSRNLRPRKFSLASPPIDLPTFPFSVGEFGTGANFALRRIRGLALGGFDTAFGVGTRTGGGEDLDLFTRVLFSGRSLVVEPAAIVWHRHRDDLAALRIQARGYGIGLGAWLTKIALNSRTAVLAVARCRSALSVLHAKAPRRTPDSGVQTLAGVGWYEITCIAQGPWQYFLQRWAGEGVLPVALRCSAHDTELAMRGEGVPTVG